MFFNKFGDFDVLRMAADSAVLQNVKATFEEKKQNLSACIIEIKCTIHKRAASGHYGVKKKKKKAVTMSSIIAIPLCTAFLNRSSVLKKNVSALLTLLIPGFSCLVQMQERESV